MVFQQDVKEMQLSFTNHVRAGICGKFVDTTRSMTCEMRELDGKYESSELFWQQE